MKIKFSRRKVSGACSHVGEDYPLIEHLSHNKDENGNNKKKAKVHLKCPKNTHISAVKFASFGTPTGTCGSFGIGDCQDPNSAAVVEKVKTVLYLKIF